jgi:RNA polymerase sigma factor (sigma-70 family)
MSRAPEEPPKPLPPPDVAQLVATFEQHLPSLSAFVRRRLGPRLAGRESSADILQSVLGDVLARSQPVGADPGAASRNETQLRAFLFKALEHKIREKERYHLAQRRTPDREAARVDGDGCATEAPLADAKAMAPSQVVHVRERLEAFDLAFAQLEDDYREVILLARFQGLSQEQTAAAMNRTVASVRNLLSRALVQFARLLEQAQRGGA